MSFTIVVETENIRFPQRTERGEERNVHWSVYYYEFLESGFIFLLFFFLSLFILNLKPFLFFFIHWIVAIKNWAASQRWWTRSWCLPWQENKKQDCLELLPYSWKSKASLLIPSFFSLTFVLLLNFHLETESLSLSFLLFNEKDGWWTFLLCQEQEVTEVTKLFSFVRHRFVFLLPSSFCWQESKSISWWIRLKMQMLFNSNLFVKEWNEIASHLYSLSICLWFLLLFMQVLFSFDDEVLLFNLLSRVEKGSLFSFRIPGNKFKFKKKKMEQ